MTAILKGSSSPDEAQCKVFAFVDEACAWLERYAELTDAPMDGWVEAADLLHAARDLLTKCPMP